MKTLIAIAILAATVGTAVAQIDLRPYGGWRQNEDQHSQEQDFRDLERRNRELENRQHEIERQRFEAQQWRNNPIISERYRQQCGPGKTIC